MIGKTISHYKIFEKIEEADGQTFIAMAYIENLSLREKINTGSMDIDHAIDVAIQVAEGLKEAHSKGVIHRDIKPRRCSGS